MSAAAQQPAPRARRAGRWIRALRLPFVGASALPYLLGAASAESSAPDWVPAVCLGLVVVVAAHLCANVANDVADTDSGVDTRDPTHHGFFGGSKVLCEGLVPRRALVRAAALCGSIAALALAGLAALRGSVLPLGVAAGALALALAYSLPPVRLAYRGAGEATVGLLFGPVAVLAGHYARGGQPFAPLPLRLGLAAGLLVAAILVANEVPDAPDDALFGKRTLVVRLGPQNGWLLFVALVAAAFGIVAGAVPAVRPVGVVAASALGVPLAAGAASRLRNARPDKFRLRAASARAIALQAAVVGVLALEQAL